MRSIYTIPKCNWPFTSKTAFLYDAYLFRQWFNKHRSTPISESIPIHYQLVIRILVLLIVTPCFVYFLRLALLGRLLLVRKIRLRRAQRRLLEADRRVALAQQRILRAEQMLAWARAMLRIWAQIEAGAWHVVMRAEPEQVAWNKWPKRHKGEQMPLFLWSLRERGDG